MDELPHLVPRKISLGLKAIGVVFPGARRTTAQIHPYTEWWSVQNQAAVRGDGPLLVGIGDSILVGIGASHPSISLLGLVGEALSQRDGRRWRVINLAIPGARVDDALERQLPLVEQVGTVDQFFCCIGTNDIVWTPALQSLRAGLRSVSDALPPGTVFGPVAGASQRARLANRALREQARINGQLVAPIWNSEHPSKLRDRIASDRFHPNDLGYSVMADVVMNTLSGAPTDRESQ
ncbi:MAG: SGNH/GDSL hydrolase family protein [Acidimicrobiales bacterium]|nr:SGNH/GDSL hydrolase family protein [Acidimicrobiales bacterium]